MKGARQANDLRTEFKLTAQLGAPLALGELGWMSTYIVDALMIGRLHNSALPIAASSLGNTIFYALAFCAIFLLNGLETLVAQAFGSGERNECVFLLCQSLWIALIGTPIVMLLTLGVCALLPRLGTPPEIAAETSRYLHALVWSTAPLLGYMALRRFLQSVNRVVLISVSLITASIVNLIWDWAFLFGHLGAKPMGIAGSGWSTLVVRLYMLLLLVAGAVWAVKQDGYQIRARMLVPSWPRIRALLGIGWPSALQSLEELGESTFLSLLCARLGTVLLAAHQVVLDLNAFVYQVPAGLSYATIVRVGQSAGRNSVPQVKRATAASLWLGLGFITIAATVFAAFAKFWAGLYTNSAAVVAAAAPIFLICAFALVGDALFVLLSSALTGLGDTRTPFMVSLLWNWGVAMPLAYALTFHFGLGLTGLWLGRAAGSVGTGLHLAVAWRLRLRRLSEGSRRLQLNVLPLIATNESAV